MDQEERLPSGKHAWRIDSFSKKKNELSFSSEAFTFGMAHRCRVRTVRTFPSGKHTWRTDSFSKEKNERSFSSEAFTVGGCKWQIVIYPGGEQDQLEVYLRVADATALPDGWCRDVKSVFTLVDQLDGVSSITKGGRVKFTAQSSTWGNQFMPLTELLDHTKGYLVADTVVVEVKITLYEIVPPVELATQKGRFDSYFSSASKDFGAAGISHLGEGSASDMPSTDLASETPSSDEIEKAKQSLKECLSDLFKLNMRDRLSSALSILSRARAELSPDQHRSIETFEANFDGFVRDFLNFEQDNADFELQKITRDQTLAAMKKNRETHISNQRLSDCITKEKEELEKSLQELRFKETKLICDWESLVKEDEEAKSRYTVQEEKLVEAEEKKKIAEERMSRSTSAWASLKEQFL